MQRYRPDIAWDQFDGRSTPIMAEDSEKGDYYHKDDVETEIAARDQTIKDLGFQLGMAEEGLANYAREVASLLNSNHELMMQGVEASKEIERLRAALAYAINTSGGIKPDDYEYVAAIASRARDEERDHRAAEQEAVNEHVANTTGIRP